jgi:hypothetical protein
MVVLVVVGVSMQIRKGNARESALQAIGPVALRVDKDVALHSDPVRLSVARPEGGSGGLAVNGRHRGDR